MTANTTTVLPDARAREVLQKVRGSALFLTDADAIAAMLEYATQPAPDAAVPADTLLTAAVNQNDAMRQELANVGNLVSDLARAMHVDQANADGSWPDLAGRLGKLIAAAPKVASEAGADIVIGDFIAKWEDAAEGACMDADTAQLLAREFKRMRTALGEVA